MTNTPDEILAAVRRTEQTHAEQIASWDSLEIGTAFSSDAFPGLAAANQLRDVWLQEIGAEDAYERCESLYTDKGLTCRRWTPALAQDPAPIDALLAKKGWTRRNVVAMQLCRLAVPDDSHDSIRILPARAMKRAYRATFESGSGEEAAAGIERLNDANYDAVVAVIDGKSAGRAAFLEAGDIARLADVFVLPALRRRGVGRALGLHFLKLVQRLSPRLVVAACPSSDEQAIAYLGRTGFDPAGDQPTFERPPA